MLGNSFYLRGQKFRVDPAFTKLGVAAQIEHIISEVSKLNVGSYRKMYAVRNCIDHLCVNAKVGAYLNNPADVTLLSDFHQYLSSCGVPMSVQLNFISALRSFSSYVAAQVWMCHAVVAGSLAAVYFLAPSLFCPTRPCTPQALAHTKCVLALAMPAVMVAHWLSGVYWTKQIMFRSCKSLGALRQANRI